MKKKSKKRVLSALLAVAMVVSLYSSLTFADGLNGQEATPR